MYTMVQQQSLVNSLFFPPAQPRPAEAHCQDVAPVSAKNQGLSRGCGPNRGPFWAPSRHRNSSGNQKSSINGDVMVILTVNINHGMYIQMNTTYINHAISCNLNIRGYTSEIDPVTPKIEGLWTMFFQEFYQLGCTPPSVVM